MGFFSELFGGSQSNIIRSAVREAAGHMQVHRRGQPFVDAELALGLAAFVFWLERGLAAAEAGQREFMATPNESARNMAIVFAEVILAGPAATRAIRRRFPDFDHQAEQLQALQNSSQGPWMASLTRAIILVCRGLAYSTTGFQPRLTVPDDTPVAEFERAAVSWVAEALDSNIADTIRNRLVKFRANDYALC
jgi:hypothetical protein